MKSASRGRGKPTLRHVSSVCRPPNGDICPSLAEINGQPECSSKEKKPEEKLNDNCSGPPLFLVSIKTESVLS
ncbi:MAG: hypothetical protein Q8Q06_00955 [bacterium]|nr:hypothetical protein [bacterium]